MRVVIFAAAGAALALGACQKREPAPEAPDVPPSVAGPAGKSLVAEPDGAKAMGAKITGAEVAEPADAPVTPLKELGGTSTS